MTAVAQIDVSTKLEYAAYLQYEPINVVTTIKSHLGQPAVFNLRPDDLKFVYIVRDDYGNELAKLPDAEMPSPEMIPARSSGVMTNNILNLFPLARTGYYSIQPAVEWMGKSYTGEKKYFEVVNGREVSRMSGRIQADGTLRTYVVYHLVRNQQDHLLLRIDDEENSLCYGVFLLGRIIISDQPELVLDVEGNAHVLFQTAPRVFVHMTYSPFGKAIDRQVIGKEFTNIGLKSEPNGTIVASGQPTPKSDTPGFIKSILDKKPSRSGGKP